MSGRQRIVPVRRQYNQWVANQTLEDYALRFTAERARRWSPLRVGHTALAAISFLALEAIGGAITLSYGFTNAALAILVVGGVIFAAGLPISYYAAKHGVDIDLLTRGAGFGYIGSTITSLIYASFTFIFFAIEAAIMALALEICFGIPLAAGYLASALVVIPLVTHGITLISRFQLWTQPLWFVLHVLPFAFIAYTNFGAFEDWTEYPGVLSPDGGAFNLLFFGAASTVIFSLVAQIGEQVDFLRFLPRKRRGNRLGWWVALISAGPGWIVLGGAKMMAGSFLAVLALQHGVPFDRAAEPTQMYLVAFRYVLASPDAALILMGVFVVVSQLKINVTNAYAGSIAWSNFFSRLTHSHPGRVVWLVFNVAIALLLMELGIYGALEQTLGLYSIVVVSWVGALAADLVINKPLGLSPPQIEFKRAHLYDVNPVGVGAMIAATAAGLLAYAGTFGEVARAFAPFLALATALFVAPAIAAATRGRYYLARKPRAHWRSRAEIRCHVCEHDFEPQDMAFCPIYSGPICSLCCSLDARCDDGCKPHARLGSHARAMVDRLMPAWAAGAVSSRVMHFLGVFLLLGCTLGLILSLIYFQASVDAAGHGAVIANTLWGTFFILTIAAGIAAWLFVLAHESRRVAEDESAGQTRLLMREIAAHRLTDAKLEKAKQVAETANLAKSRYVIGISHELRTPLNAILGYAQLLERDEGVPPARAGGIRVIRRSAEHLSGLIDGLLDISKIEAGRLNLNRDEVRLPEFLDQMVEMFRLQAAAKGLSFDFRRPERIPAAVHTDEKRLRQILINLLSNAIKFTERGGITLKLAFRSGVADFELADTGIGIGQADLERIFEPFERGNSPDALMTQGIGLGLTITKLLTEIMGGEISVVSTEGQGTTFRVRLLLSAVPHPVAESAEAAIRGYGGRPRTIIVADDDPAHRDLMREILAPLGFILFTAPDGPTCLKLAQECTPDLFLLDVSMPGMDGLELARRLRAAGHVQAGIIMVSANVADGRIDPQAGSNYDELMAKPVRVRVLLDRVGARLKLDWLHAAEPVLDPAAPPAQRDWRPARAELEELRRLGGIGYVRGIERELERIEADWPGAGPFVADLRGLVQNFELRRYMRRLEDATCDD